MQNVWGFYSFQSHKSCSYRQTASCIKTYLQVMMMVFSPSHEGLSAMTLAWVVTSCGDSCGDSLGWVWIQPRGSISCLSKGTKLKT